MELNLISVISSKAVTSRWSPRDARDINRTQLYFSFLWPLSDLFIGGILAAGENSGRPVTFCSLSDCKRQSFKITSSQSHFCKYQCLIMYYA